MAAFITLTTNAFEHMFKKLGRARKYKLKRGAGADSVRRPLRGMEIKDNTHAVIRIMTATGENIPLVTSSYKGGKGEAFTNFILQSVQEVREEKAQVVETFGEDYVFLYGEKPRFLQVDAVLFNSFDFNWEAEFWENYDRYLRGTKCAELGARIYMFYDDSIVEGYLLNAMAKKTAENTKAIPLSFKMLVTNYSNVSLVETSEYPFHGEAFVDYTEFNKEYFETIGLESPEWLTPIKKSVVDQNDIRFQQREKRLRTDITDNLDEWTGRRYSYNNFSKKEKKPIKKKVADKAKDELKTRKVDADKPSVFQAFGFAGVSIGDPTNNSFSGKPGASNRKGGAPGVTKGVLAASVGVSVGIGLSSNRSPNSPMGQGYYKGQTMGYTPANGKYPSSNGYYAGVGYRAGPEGLTASFGSGTYNPNTSNPYWSPGKDPYEYAQGSNVYTAYDENGYSCGYNYDDSDMYSYAVAGYKARRTTAKASAMYYSISTSSWDPDHGYNTCTSDSAFPGTQGNGVFTVYADDTYNEPVVDPHKHK